MAIQKWISDFSCNGISSRLWGGQQTSILFVTLWAQQSVKQLKEIKFKKALQTKKKAFYVMLASFFVSIEKYLHNIKSTNFE